jgi:pSer/pThr/pTyr-binding forkhead associated (FHA) protein
MPTVADDADATGTYFFASPVKPSGFRLVQVLEGGAHGLTHCPKSTKATIGRHGCDLNVPGDKHLSLEHCSIERDADGFSLIDLDSKNGTYTRVKGDHAVDHGDYFIVGREVLRIELNA